jgi:hypothetical protein
MIITIGKGKEKAIVSLNTELSPLENVALI